MSNNGVIMGVALVIFTVLLYFVSDVIAPFIVAFIFAYLLQPLIEFLQSRLKLNKAIAVALSLIVFITMISSTLILMLPIIYKQSSSFIASIPRYQDLVLSQLLPSIQMRLQHLDPKIAATIYNAVQDLGENMFSGALAVFSNIWVYTLATVNIITFMVLVPVIMFYFMRDWGNITKSIAGMLPVNTKDKAHKIAVAINELLSAYVRGQLNICVLLAAYYAVTLTLIGLEFSLLLGVLSGFLIILPFVGTFVSFALAALVAYVSSGISLQLLYVFILYSLGSLVEGYYLTPKIIGNKIGLHPVWIMLAVIIGASWFGFTGVLIAIPVAGICKILLTHLITGYKGSKLYNG